MYRIWQNKLLLVSGKWLCGHWATIPHPHTNEHAVVVDRWCSQQSATISHTRPSPDSL